ncbi:MAG: alpha-galactosidase [Planctomycetia bacterium]|nr:alpha-galactosidase [Planctomycetia bacterium]
MTSTTTLLMTLVLGPWLISFDEHSSVLTLQNEEQNVRLSGKAEFVRIPPRADFGSSYQTPKQIEDAKKETYRIVLPRDNGPRRLSIIDSRQTVIGYISFQQNGHALEFHVHPTARMFDGKFVFRPDVQFEPDAFPCRFRPIPGRRVVNMASGPADSWLNDCLFSVRRDTLVEICGPVVRLETRKPGEFALELSGDGVQTFGVNVRKDFFRNRDVPHYTPIDKKRCPSPPTGWMSWNIYFDKAGAQENLAEARLGKKYFQPFGMEFWSIESWQGNSDKLPVSKFYNINGEVNEEQFPDGMKKLADELRALGFRPGMWIVPFGTGNPEFYESHRSWFMHFPNGTPVSTWAGKYTLDPSHPEVLAHLRTILAMYRDWGYEFFKIDGMSIGSYYPTQQTWKPELQPLLADTKHGNWIERFLRNLRAGLGDDAVILACGTSVTAPGVLIADATRIGADIVQPNKPVMWENILRQAQETLKRLYTHNIIAYNDPDTLMVNDAISLEEARVTTTVVSLPGQVTFDGDKLAELPPERIRLIQQALPVCDVHPSELYSIWDRLPVWNLAVARPFLRWNVVAVFNWSDTEKEEGFTFAELGQNPDQEYALYEFWTNTLTTASREFRAKLPPHSVRLYAVHPIQNHPQFLSSDRHTTQGAVDLTDLQWDGQTLSGRVKLVEKHPTTLRFLTRGTPCVKADSDATVQVQTEQEGNVLAVTLVSETTREARFTLHFPK